MAVKKLGNPLEWSFPSPAPNYRELKAKNIEKNLVPPGLEPGTFRVLSERDNHYTTELIELCTK